MTHEMAPATMDAEATLEPADTISRFFEALETGDYPVLLEVLTPDAITRWPQSGERITGAMACLRVYEKSPGGPRPIGSSASPAAEPSWSRRCSPTTAMSAGMWPASSNSRARGSRG